MAPDITFSALPPAALRQCKSPLLLRHLRLASALALLLLLSYALDARTYARRFWRALTIDPAVYLPPPSGATCRCARNGTAASDAALLPLLPPPPQPPLYTAVLIETRASASVVFAVRHMACVLPPSWVLLMVSTRAMRGFLQREFGDLLASARLQVWELAEAQRTLERWCPLGSACVGRGCWHAPPPASSAARLTWSHSWGLANEILMSEEFYRVLPTEHFLLFQTDGLLCRALSEQDSAALAQYDYVGAPWDWEEGNARRGGNGGLSFRAKSVLLRVIAAAREAQWAEAPLLPDQDNAGWNEDMFFVVGAERSAIARAGARLPPSDFAKAFAVEALYHERPWGFHKPWRYLGENQLRALIEQCPVVAECLAWTPASGPPVSCRG